MKLSIKATFTASLLVSGLLSSNLLAGSSDGGDITMGVPQPHFRTSVTVREGYDDNVFTSSTNRVSSAFTQADLNTFADLGNERTMFTIGLGLGAYWYYDRPGKKVDWSDNISINFSHKVNERLTLGINNYTAYQVEPQYDLDVAQNRRNGQYLYTTTNINATYQWTRRFSTVTGYSVTGIFYEDATAKIVNDYVQQTFSNQFRYLLLPTTTLVAEYRFGMVNYLYQNDRNTITNYILVGADHTFSPKLSATFRVGGQIQDQDVGGTSTSPYGELNVTYNYQRYSNIHFYLNYGFQYSNLALNQNDKALRTGITINHGFTPKLTANLGFYYQHDDYSETNNTPGSAYTEDTLDLNTGLRYQITPKLSLDLNYTLTELLSDHAGLGYHRNTVSVGATYTF